LIYDQSDLNERAKKTFGELYAKTLERDCLIRSLGYNLIVQWETEIEEYQDYIDSFKAHGEHTNPG